jgi:hypothetical protein
MNNPKYNIVITRENDALITNTYDLINNTSNTSINYTITNLPKNNRLTIVVKSVYPNITLTSTGLTFQTYGSPRNIYIVPNSITDTSAIFQFSPPLKNVATSYKFILTGSLIIML